MTPPWSPARLLDGLVGRRRETMEIDDGERRVAATGFTEAVQVNGWVDPPAQTSVPGEAVAPLVRVVDDAPDHDGAPAGDPVESPGHYCRRGFELGEILYVWDLSHRRASAVEYIMRAGDKDPAREAEDLRKAIRNLQMELEYMERYGRRGGA